MHGLAVSVNSSVMPEDVDMVDNIILCGSQSQKCKEDLHCNRDVFGMNQMPNEPKTVVTGYKRLEYEMS